MMGGVGFIRSEMCWDKYDPYGSVMHGMFDLCAAWWHATGQKLNGYEPSVITERGVFEEYQEREEILYMAIKDDIITISDVTYWLKVLDRMLNLVEIAGRAY